MRNGQTELLSVEYSASAHSFKVDGKTFKLEAGDTPVVHAFVDGSVIEVILSERVGYTKRFYYASPVAPDIDVHATQTGSVDLSAWSITPISPNRLTTPARTV